VPNSITGWLQWLENTTWAVTIRQSEMLYPVLEIVHITGIAVLVGAAFMFDFRLLGFGNNIPVSALARHVLPWSRRSLLLVIPSGLLLFITNAEALGYDPTFWLKMLLLVLAGLNAAVFHRYTFIRRVSAWDAKENLPLGAKIAASASLILWIAIIACGRLLAY
jgi:hypothetical protein